MSRYVSMLRGINVSGQRRIKMDELRSLFESLGFGNVKTYIQSGNVIFDSRRASISKLASAIEIAIEKTFGFSVVSLVRTKADIRSPAENNPFLEAGKADLTKLHVTFLSDKPSKSAIEGLEALDYGADQFQISGQEIYLFCPGGHGKPKLSNNLFERKLGISATTRNRKTVIALCDLSA